MTEIAWDALRAELIPLYRRGRARATADQMARVLARVGRLGVSTTADVTPALVERFAASEKARGSAPNTIAGQLSYFRAACSYAVARGYLDRSPFGAWSGFATAPLPREDAVYHPPEAVARVLEHLSTRAGDTFASRRLSVFAALLAYTGCRRTEALGLVREDADMARAVVRIRPNAARRLKRATARRDVPMRPELRAALADYLPLVEWSDWLLPGLRGRGPWCNASAGYRPENQLRAAGVACGVTEFVPSSLRHSFGTTAALIWGILPAQLMALMGHTSIETTMRYYVHADAENLRPAIDRVRWSG